MPENISSSCSEPDMSSRSQPKIDNLPLVGSDGHPVLSLDDLKHLREARDEEIEQELEDAGLVEPPDGGWGWVVVAGSFLANCIVDGIICTAGSGFQPLWQTYFNASSSSTAWAVSLLSGVYLLAGPIVSALANYFGCRAVTMFGTLLSTAGFLLSQFVQHLPVLYFTFGVMGGIGFGLIYLPSIVIVSYYFKKRRAFATGLAVCGSGIGTFAFAPLIKFLLDQFTWQQCILILSGITLHGLVCGAVFRKLEPTAKQYKKVEDIARQYRQSNQDIRHSIQDVTANGKGHLPYSESSHDDAIEEVPYSPHVAEGVAIERFRRRTRTASNVGAKPFMSVMELHARQRQTSMFSIPQKTSGSATSNDELYRYISRESVTQLNRPLSRMDVFYPGSSLSLHQRAAATTVTSKHSLLLEPAMVIHTRSWTENVKAVLLQMLDFSLLKSPSFLILALGGFLTLCGFFVPFIYLPRVSLSFGHSKEQAIFLVSVLGITNIIARIICGWLSDNPRLDALMIHNVAVTIAGIATVFVTFYHQYWMLCLYCIVFGFGTACFASLRSIICVELLGLEKLTNAFGFLLLFMGVAAIVGAPMAGALYDATGTYDMSFYVTGGLVTLSGLVGFPLKMINRWENRGVVMEGESESSEYDEEDGMDLPGSRSFPMKRIPTNIPEVSEEEEEDEKEKEHDGVNSESRKIKFCN